MADLEANFMHLQLMHESLTRFSESFASFLYGLNMNAFCVDFPEVWSQTRRRQLWKWKQRERVTDSSTQAPIPDSFKKANQDDEEEEKGIARDLCGKYLGALDWLC